jgi:hypothetical protein
MAAAKVKPQTIDEYIATFPKDVQQGLEKLRRTIGKAAPQAAEVLSYGMPAFKVFKKESDPYHISRATLQLPFEKPISVQSFD